MTRNAPQKSRYLTADVLEKIGSLELAARHVVEGLRVGVHKSPLRGFSTEFAHHRGYVPGDPLRHIDWRVYGRTERYYVKLYEAETNFDANLLIDASASMRYGSTGSNKLEYAKYMAASLAYLIVHQRDSVGLGVFDAKLRSYLRPKGSISIIRDIARELEQARPLERTDVAGVLHDMAVRIPRRGVVMIFSDLLEGVDEFIKGLDHLRFRGHNVIVFQILDPDELHFPFRGTCRFRGLEDAAEVLTQPNRIRSAYLEELGQLLQKVRRSCERRQADYVLVDTSRPLDEVLMAYILGAQREAMR
jgi:uncharacterized protein (DUF58 family)